MDANALVVVEALGDRNKDPRIDHAPDPRPMKEGQDSRIEAPKPDPRVKDPSEKDPRLADL